MISNLCTNATNCTGVQIGGVYHVLQITFLSLFLVYILVLNLLVIGAILTTTELRGCWFSMQMASSYIGNIFAGLSLIGNALYYSENGNPPIRCQAGKDKHFFLYFGTSMNTIIVLFNTHFRYDQIVSMKQNHNISTKTNAKNLILKSLLPAWLTSVFISTIASFLQCHIMEYRFLINVGICIIPMTITIVWNILLSRYLRQSRKNPVIVQRHESLEVIERATFIINVTIATHIIFLIVGSCATLLITFSKGHYNFVVRMTWLLRVAYLGLFTVEAKVYLYKVALARNVIKRKVSNFALSLRRNTVNAKRTNKNIRCVTQETSP